MYLLGIYTVCIYRRDLDVDEVMVDAAAEWKPVEKPPDAKEEDGKCHLMCGFIHVHNTCTCIYMYMYVIHTYNVHCIFVCEHLLYK